MASHPSLQILPVAPQGRVLRKPQHSFQLRYSPWEIQPFFIAPVLPGETMRNLLLMSRCKTAPLANNMLGWWTEHYFFYVKHRDLNEREDLTRMVLEADYDLSALYTPPQEVTYHAGGVDWTSLCLDRVVQEYFRGEEEDPAAGFSGRLPMLGVNRPSFLDSVKLDTEETQPDAILPGSAEGYEPFPGFEASYEQWQHMAALRLTDATYEDFLRSYGVRPQQREESHRPELVRYSKAWTYPSNVVDPVTGEASGAAVWSINERADKDRLFREPGFLFGVTVTRPKVFMSQLRGSAVSLMDNAFAWLPALLADNPYTSLRKVTNGEGPIRAAEGDYWVDLRDLLLYGDQFVNFDLQSADGAGAVALPTSSMEKRYPSSVDIASLFSNSSTWFVQQEGLVTLNIAGRQQDTTPTTYGQAPAVTG